VVPRAASHQWEPVGKSHQWRRPWEAPHPRRSQLNDQLESIEPLTDRGHRGGVALREGEVWPDVPGAFDEEPERLGGRERAEENGGPPGRSDRQRRRAGRGSQPALSAVTSCARPTRGVSGTCKDAAMSMGGPLRGLYLRESPSSIRPPFNSLERSDQLDAGSARPDLALTPGLRVVMMRQKPIHLVSGSSI
jgi:hypothetical protein